MAKIGGLPRQICRLSLWINPPFKSVTPSQIYGWEGPGSNVLLTGTTETRMLSEQRWYALTGRAVGLKVEADGDIHIALEDADGKRVGTVSAEIPVGPKWCEIRQTVFGWTTQKFPFGVKSAHALKIRGPHVITVTGKAFYDIAHAPADHFKSATDTERIRRVGNSSGDESRSDAMKYWEIIADNLKERGWSLGWVSTLDAGRANNLDC
jgi:hypothetical protein